MINRTSRQKLGIKKWLDAGGKGTWTWSTGVGKTRGSCMIIRSLIKRNPEIQVLIAVPTEVLKDQWMKILIDQQIFMNCKVEIINTIVKNQWECDLFIIDEAHRAASDTFKKAFECVNYSMILCLTATLERLDGKEYVIKQYAPVVDEITVEEAIENRWLSPFREYLVLIDVDDIDEYNIINQNFINYFSYFNYDFALAMKLVKDARFRNTYAKKFGLDHKAITAMAMDWNTCMRKRKQFVMSHPKKFEIANKIIQHRPDSKIITFSATINDTEKINYGKTLHSGKTKNKNRITLEEFNILSSGVLNTAKSLDEGSDIEGLNTAIIISNTSSSRQKTQRIGRTIRFEENKIAEIFTLVIQGTTEVNWFNNSTTTSYITINEEQLDMILKGQKLDLRSSDNIKNISYRF